MTPAERLQEIEGYQVPSLHQLREDVAWLRAHVECIAAALRDPFAEGAADVLASAKPELNEDACANLLILGRLLQLGLLMPTKRAAKGAR